MVQNFGFRYTKKYLILFDEYKKQFIKVNDWKEAYEIVFWTTGCYYLSLDELI